MSSAYSFDEHIHRFAVWTAARAVQRNFTTTAKIRIAIEQTDLKKLLQNEQIATKDFKSFHIQCCNTLIASFAESKEHATYGQAAKIVAIYIKTAIIISKKEGSLLTKIAHPPIDRILLTAISKKHPIKIINWTQLNEERYWELIQKLSDISNTFYNGEFWMLEKDWNPE